MNEAFDLIRSSIDEDRIVTADHAADLELGLMSEAEDSADNGATIEFWGSIGAGGAWRVHLERRGGSL
jgi:hypothetical protein